MMRYIKNIFSNKQAFILIAILAIHTCITLIYVHHQPLTNDEADYIEYAKRWLEGSPDKILDVDDSKTPIVAIAWVPRIIKQVISPSLQLNDWGRADQMAGRYMMLLFFWLVFLYTALWSKKLYGKNGWWLPIILLVIDPLFMAFSPIVTSDMASVFVLLASCYHYYSFCKTQSFKQFLLAAFFTGLALITKSSMLFIPLIFLFIYIGRLLAKQAIIPLGKKAVGYAVLFMLIVWLTLNTGFYFHHSFQPWKNIAFKSSTFNNLFTHLSYLKDLPTLLPEPFIRGFDLLEYHKEFGPFVADMPYKGVFILNQKFTSGVWYYYLVTGGLKFTIGFLLLTVISIAVFFKKFSATSFCTKYIFIVLPVLMYGFLLSFVNPFQQGIRHAMILLPFIFLGIGYLAANQPIFTKKIKPLLLVLVGYSFISAASFFPDIMPYTNEIITNKTKVFNYIAEYNYRLSDVPLDTKPFLDAHPDFSIAPSTPTKGKFIIPGAYVFNTTYEINPRYKWLQQYQPIGHYRYVFLLYNVQ